MWFTPITSKLGTDWLTLQIDIRRFIKNNENTTNFWTKAFFQHSGRNVILFCDEKNLQKQISA